ncbi:MAG TPA: TetR/AcrR family transcriptional regulator [Solirubrobacterales bacterium]|nr:TetR/AcrR family transcriptional regulator [Solirubrobacterales bacterium]
MDAFRVSHEDAREIRHGGRRSAARHDRAAPLQSIPRDERREVILDRIVDFLNREGTSESDWTIAQLARSANTTRVTLYEYFGNLDGVRAAVQFRLVGRVKSIVQELYGIPREERRAVAVATWMSWVDQNRRLAIRALWIEDSNPAFKTFVNGTAQSLIRQIADVFLGVEQPSRALQRQIEVYLRGAEFCLRMWLLEGRMQRAEVQTTIERLTEDVVRMGETRDDVPKPIPT